MLLEETMLPLRKKLEGFAVSTFLSSVPQQKHVSLVGTLRTCVLLVSTWLPEAKRCDEASAASTFLSLGDWWVQVLLVQKRREVFPASLSRWKRLLDGRKTDDPKK